MARVPVRSISIFARALSTRQSKARMTSVDWPEVFSPPINKSMIKLDRSFFKKTVPVAAATIFDVRKLSDVRKTLDRTHELLKLTSISPIINDDSMPNAKAIILSPSIAPDNPQTWSPELDQLVKDGIAKIRPYDLTLTYDAWPMSNILEAILPDMPEDEQETPAGFAQVGHVAHLNLRDQYLPYKYLIGEVLADKNPTVKTVINKTLDVGTISQYRTFPYEVLAGPDDLNVTVSHEGCILEFDFSKVYFNTRLQTEHRRLIAKFQEGQAVCDVMAGVGPFSLPAGRKKVWVRANDLNPEAYSSIQHNIRKNKVADFVMAKCEDGREFIKNETRNLHSQPRQFIEIPKKSKSRSAPQHTPPKRKTFYEPISFDHYVMNLPATAVEFLDAFKGLYAHRESEFEPNTDRKLPMVHVHLFQARRPTEEQEVQEICETVSKHLGAEIKSTDPDIEIYYVRLVAPNKKMYCASFRLPPAVALDVPRT